MRIAVTSQNRKTITGHAGKCRKFWIYDVEAGQVGHKHLMELPMEQSFHESPAQGPHPLDDIDVLICGGMGPNLMQRLERKGIRAMATPETDPDQAVSAWLSGSLPVLAADPHHHHDHAHGHEHGDDHDHTDEHSHGQPRFLTAHAIPKHWK